MSSSKGECLGLQLQIDKLRAELTSVQTALSLVLSAEHRKLVVSKDVKKVFQEMVREMRDEENRDHMASQARHELAYRQAEAQRCYELARRQGELDITRKIK